MFGALRRRAFVQKLEKNKENKNYNKAPPTLSEPKVASSAQTTSSHLQSPLPPLSKPLRHLKLQPEAPRARYPPKTPTHPGKSS